VPYQNRSQYDPVLFTPFAMTVTAASAPAR
jgi:hypothetical protein